MYQVFIVSDRAIQIDWNSSSSKAEHPVPLPGQLANLRQALVDKLSVLGWPEFQCIQADQSITVLFANASSKPHHLVELTAQLNLILSKAGKLSKGSHGNSRQHTLCVNYGGPAGQDLDWLAQQTGLTTNEIIDLHCSVVYTVDFLGFLPGFAYLSGLPEKLQFPRRATPRARVPAGTLAIGANYCAVYPWESPGGWHLLGHVAQVLFNPEQTAERGQSFFQAGDSIQFIRAEHA